MIGFYAAGAMGAGGGGGGPGPMPTYQNISAASTTTAATLNAVWPSGHIAGDLGIAIVLSPNVAPVTPSGWDLLAQVGAGMANAALSTMLSVYGRIAASSSEPAAAIGRGSASFLQGRVMSFRGVAPSSYVDDSAQASGATSSTIALPGVTTTDINRLVLLLLTDGTDASGVRYSNWTNAGLTSLTERADGGTATNTGGGYGAATGERAVAGSIGAGSVDFALSASNYAAVTIALKPLNL